VLEVFGEVLPASMAVALSPFPVIAIVVVLGAPRAQLNGALFSLGWVAGLTVLASIVALAAEGVAGDDGEPSTIIGWVRLAVGVALLAAAAKKWQGRPRRGDERPTPRWMASLDGLTPGRALGLGAVLAAANPKNLALALSAASSVVDADLGAGAGVAAVAAFVLLGSSTVVGTTLVHRVGGARAQGPLESLKTFMLDNATVITIVVLLVLGAKVAGDGLAAIAG
jgi:threonine/homoserine/homoserine lactone efflux protein